MSGVADRLRAWVAGPSEVTATEEHWGIPADTYAPAEYGTYLATSNAVYACATRRAELLARLPLRVYTVAKDGTKAEVTSGDLFTILSSPNPWYDGDWLRELTQLDMDLWGRAFWMLERGTGGKGPVREIWRVRPDRVTVVPDRVNYVKGYLLADAGGGEPIPYTPDEVIAFRYPNPLEELSGLSPLGAARLGADLGSAAMKANRALFGQGMMGAGLITPTEGDAIWTEEQARQVRDSFERQMKGVDKAHKWAVFRTRVDAQTLSWSPKDAQHLQTMQWSLEEVARAYRIPLDLLRGETTYENQDAAMRSIYTHAVLPCADRMANNLTRRLAPMFGQVVLIEHDASQVEVLQENRAELVTQVQALAGIGVPLNRLLQEFMPQLLPESGDGYPWGDVAWLPMGLAPIGEAPDFSEPEPPPDMPVVDEEPMMEPAMDESRTHHRMEYGSPEHRAHWESFVRKTDPLEAEFRAVVVEAFQAWRKSVVAKLGGRADPDIDKVIDRKRWQKELRARGRPSLLRIARVGVTDVLAMLGKQAIGLNPVVAFVEARAQRFAEQVSETIWLELRATLSEGIDGAEGIGALVDRVNESMGTAIRSSATTIARTEVVGAYNGGGLIAAKEVGAETKEWVSAMDDRTRDSHLEAHGQRVGIDEDFELEGGSGPAPGQIGEAEEDINCRCSLIYPVEIPGKG